MIPSDHYMSKNTKNQLSKQKDRLKKQKIHVNKTFNKLQKFSRDNEHTHHPDPNIENITFSKPLKSESRMNLEYFLHSSSFCLDSDDFSFSESFKFDKHSPHNFSKTSQTAIDIPKNLPHENIGHGEPTKNFLNLKKIQKIHEKPLCLNSVQEHDLIYKVVEPHIPQNHDLYYKHESLATDVERITKEPDFKIFDAENKNILIHGQPNTNKNTQSLKSKCKFKRFVLEDISNLQEKTNYNSIKKINPKYSKNQKDEYKVIPCSIQIDKDKVLPILFTRKTESFVIDKENRREIKINEIQNEPTSKYFNQVVDLGSTKSFAGQIMSKDHAKNHSIDKVFGTPIDNFERTNNSAAKNEPANKTSVFDRISTDSDVLDQGTMSSTHNKPINVHRLDKIHSNTIKNKIEIVKSPVHTLDFFHKSKLKNTIISDRHQKLQEKESSFYPEYTKTQKRPSLLQKSCFFEKNTNCNFEISIDKKIAHRGDHKKMTDVNLAEREQITPNNSESGKQKDIFESSTRISHFNDSSTDFEICYSPIGFSEAKQPQQILLNPLDESALKSKHHSQLALYPLPNSNKITVERPKETRVLSNIHHVESKEAEETLSDVVSDKSIYKSNSKDFNNNTNIKLENNFNFQQYSSNENPLLILGSSNDFYLEADRMKPNLSKMESFNRNHTGRSCIKKNEIKISNISNKIEDENPDIMSYHENYDIYHKSPSIHKTNLESIQSSLGNSGLNRLLHEKNPSSSTISKNKNSKSPLLNQIQLSHRKHLKMDSNTIKTSSVHIGIENTIFDKATPDFLCNRSPKLINRIDSQNPFEGLIEREKSFNTQCLSLINASNIFDFTLLRKSRKIGESINLLDVKNSKKYRFQHRLSVIVSNQIRCGNGISILLVDEFDSMRACIDKSIYDNNKIHVGTILILQNFSVWRLEEPFINIVHETIAEIKL